MNTATRAAASSSASGSPSSRSQIRPIAVRSSASTSRSGRTDLARARNSSAASCGSKGGTSIRCSPRIRSGSRLVDSTPTRGAALSRSATTPPASSRCSKLSSTSKSSRRASALSSACSGDSPATGAISSTRDTSATITARSGIGARGTIHTPSRYWPTIAPATSSASLVLPAPPGPHSVSSRTSRPVRNSNARDISSPRPMSAFSGVGRLERRSRSVRAATTAGG